MTPKLLVTLRKCNSNLKASSLENYLRLLLQLCRDYDHLEQIRNLEIVLLLKRFDSALMIADSWSSQKYDDRTLHFVLNQFAALIRKYPWGKLVKADPMGEAIRKFVRSETFVRRINQRFASRFLRSQRSGKSLPYEDVFERARRFIAYAIGVRPDLPRIFDKTGFGPGANVGVHGQCTGVSRKLLASSWTVSPGAYVYAYWAICRHAQFREVLIPEHRGFTSGTYGYDTEKVSYARHVSVIRHNKITFVPKTALVHRTIAIEPLLNGFLQKGVDQELRLFLKRIGLDLSDQSRNQDWARLGSDPREADPFCTIDLSSASDSISTELVRTLLPPEWFEFLDSIRSKEYELNGKYYTYHKFCSMGNGFCFPLQTLIFSSLIHAVRSLTPGSDFLVYGDDIVVKRSDFDPVIQILRYCGFRVNEEKTFSSGYFRESCGADWFAMEDVRPFTLDFAIDSVEAIFKVLNLTRRSFRTELFFSGIRSFLINLIPRSLRLFRPQKGQADTGIDSLGDEHLTAPYCRFNRKLQCWSYLELIHKPFPDNHWKRERYGYLPYLWGALNGNPSNLPFAMRRSRSTKVRFTAYSGAHSTWVPALTN